MHNIEPYFNWRHEYMAEEDERSPFYGREYSEFEFTNQVYNYLLHPQWDEFGSTTLFMKILFADYDERYCIIELIGEWNDALYNDIMVLKRDVLETIMFEGIDKFIFIGENVLNFHYSDDSYYEEWFEEVEEGWIVFLNFREHVLSEMKHARLDWYIHWGGALNEMTWRPLKPRQLFKAVEREVHTRLG